MNTKSLGWFQLPLLLAGLVLGASRAVAQPGGASYTNTILPGFNLIANQLDRGANTLHDVLPDVPPGSQLLKWNPVNGTFHTDLFDDLALLWVDQGSGAASTTTLSPGEAAFLLNPGAAYPLVFTGMPHTPGGYPTLAREQLHYRSRMTNGPGNWENIVGAPPEEGALLLRWNAVVQSHETNRFAGGAWQPSPPLIHVGEGVVIRLPAGPPTIVSAPQDLIVTPGATATFTVIATGGPLTYRWFFNGAPILGGTNDTLTITNVHSRDAGPYTVEVRNAAGAVLSTPALLTISFPSSVLVSLNPAGLLGVVGTDGGERIQVRYDPMNPAQVQVVQVDGGGVPAIQSFPLSAIHGVDVDLGPGDDQLVIGIVFGPGWKVDLDSGLDAGTGMLIADERGLPVPKHSDGIVNFPLLSAAFAPVLNLGPALSNLLAQAESLRAQGNGILLGGLDLAHLANTNLVNVATGLVQQATNSLYPAVAAALAEAARLIDVANGYVAQAQAIVPPNIESLDASNLVNMITALEDQAEVYLDLPFPLSPADQAALDALLAAIHSQLAAHQSNVAAFMGRIEPDFHAPLLALEAGVGQQVAAPGEFLASVTAASLEMQLEAFHAQVQLLMAEAEGRVQSRADLLNAAARSLEAAAASLESNAASLEAGVEAFFASVPGAPGGGFAPAGGITGVNCTPATLTILSGGGLLIGTPAADLMTLTGTGGIAAGLGDNDRINGTSGTDLLLGLNGDDAIYGGAGIDFILGNNGNDCLQGEDDIDFILGGNGNDEITGGNDIDFLLGLGGDDIIEGNAGYDLVLGGAGDDMIFGGDDSDILLGDGLNAGGNDYIEGNGGTSVTILSQTYIIGNLILGQPGDDTCKGGDGIDVIFGFDGIDTLEGGDNIDLMWGGDGNDNMDGGGGGVLVVINNVTVRFGNLMFGGDGVDTMTAGADLDIQFGNDGGDMMSGANGTHALVALVNDLYFGGSGADTILGSRIGADMIFGGADADDAEGDDGNILAAPFFDFIFGMDGNDTLRGGHGLDFVFGGDGDDVIQGGDGLLDTLAGMNGMDVIDGNDGSDFVLGGPDDDVINGGDGLDACFGGQGSDLVNGNDGPDFVSGDAGDDTVNGGAGLLDLCFGMVGSDMVNGNDGIDFVFGDAGDDQCNGNDGLDLVFGDGFNASGNDIVHGNAGVDFCFGGSGQDCVFGDADPDFCDGGDDDDLVDGGAGLDLCFGNTGRDEVRGGTGPDIVSGNDGDDEVYGEDGLDVISGNDGNDKLIGGQGWDVMVGGNGNDLLMGDAGVDTMHGDGLFCTDSGDDFIYGGADRDFVFGGDGNDVIWGEGGRDILYGDCLIGGGGNDCLEGGDDNDWIFCGDGSDLAWGRNGKDRIFGGSGDDDLDGGPANDYVNGGTGSDDLYGGGGVNVLLNGTVQTGDLAGGCPHPACSEICGRKWKDLNANGALDVGEPWLLGVTIYLDLNCNGILDAGEPSMVTGPDNPATLKEDESGYCFKGLLPGTYCVREIVPPGSTQSYPAGGASHIVGLGVFSKAGGIDFGNKMCTNTQPLNLIAIIAKCGMNKILLSFSAPLDPATAANPANYSIAPLQTVVSATLVNPQTVCLMTSGTFTAGSFYELEICNVKDVCNNPLVTRNHPVAGCVLASFQCANSKLIYMVPDGNGGLNIIWDVTEDVLECSTDLLNWTVVPNASSPYNVLPNNGMKFYRVRKI